MAFTDPHIKKLVEAQLYPNEPVLWQGRPGGNLLSTKGWIFLILFWVLLPIGYYTNKEAGFNLEILLVSLFFITLFVMFVDALTRYQTLYIITDRRVFIGGKDEDGDWTVRPIQIEPKTRVMHARKWRAIHIHNPSSGDSFIARWINRLWLNVITMNDVEEAENVVKMIETIIAQTKKANDRSQT